MTVRRKRIARRVPKPKNTHSEYVIHIAFPRQKWLRESACVTFRLPYLYSVIKNQSLLYRENNRCVF